MRYFCVARADAFGVMEEVWERQGAAPTSLSVFYLSSDGSYTSVWTDDPSGEEQYRLVLNEWNIPFQEGDEQQVRTWLEGLQPG